MLRCRAAITLVLAATSVAGCVAAAGPRFPADVAAAVADHDMRRMETATLIVYYPDGRRELAERVATRMTECQAVATRNAMIHSWVSNQKPVVVLPEMPFNNAFVMPRVSGYEDIAVVPTHNTLDFTTPFGLPPDPSWIACHEIVHYVQEQQFTGFWGALNRVFGNVLSPQSGLDAWFWEGLATYYEGKVHDGAGRLHWPIWRGTFAAAYAGGGIDGDDLSELKRSAPQGHHYLVGSHFIEWLVDTYGEPRLWDLIARQGSSIIFILSVNSRFSDVYGKSLSSLIDEFDAHLRRDLPVRPRFAGQTTVRAVGSDARYARAPDGTEAVVAEDLDVPAYLEVRAADGHVLVSTNLVDVIPPRQLVVASPILVSGMSFTADGKRLYLTVIDLGATYQVTRLLRLDVASGDLDEIASGLGPGGAVSPDGTKYWAMTVNGDAWGLAELDLATLARRELMPAYAGEYVLKVAPSPDGQRLAVSRWTGSHFAIAVVTVATGAIETTIGGEPGDHAMYDASFVDADRLMFLEEVNGRFQVVVHDLAQGTRAAITDAAYTAFEPRAAGGTVRFLDRQEWRWELAEVEMAAPAAPVPVPVPVPVPDLGVGSEPGTGTGTGTGLEIQSDRPYSLFDGFFRPQLHGIALAAPSAGAFLFGVALAGGDRLGQQRWAISGYMQPTPEPPYYSLGGGYANSMLAPWTFAIAASRFRWHHGLDDDPEQAGFERYVDRTQIDATASFGRVIRGTSALWVDGVYTSDDFADLTPTRRRLGGAGAHIALDTSEGTSYGGLRRRLALALDGTYYPTRTSTLSGDALDARAELAITAPLPKLRRHRVDLGARIRSVRVGGDRSMALLEVGGAGPFSPLFERRTSEDDPPFIDTDWAPEHLRFTEPLRGFENWAMPARDAAIGELTWRYPLIIDQGWATSLYFFPAILLRELELELFGAGALIDDGTDARALHYAAGAAVTLSVYFWRAPLLVQYQVSRRGTDDEATSQLVSLGIGL